MTENELQQKIAGGKKLAQYGVWLIAAGLLTLMTVYLYYTFIVVAFAFVLCVAGILWIIIGLCQWYFSKRVSR